MYVGSRQNLKTINCDSSIMIKNELVSRVRSFTCLGVELDESLHWNDVIEMICKKVAAGIGMMKRIKPYAILPIIVTIITVLVCVNTISKKQSSLKVKSAA